MQQADDDEVDGQACRANDEHRTCVHHMVAADALDRFPEYVGRDAQQQCDVHRHSEDFEPGVAIRVARVWRAATEGGGSQREQQACRIGQTVAGVRNERQRTSEQAGNGFDHDEAERETKTDEQRLPRGLVGVRRLLDHLSMVANGAQRPESVKAEEPVEWTRYSF